VKVGGVGVLTGWGTGVGSLPADAVTAAAGRRVIGIPRPLFSDDRFRRATRECLLGIAAVEELLGTLRMARAELAGSGTALFYATASAYAASNRSFIEAGGGTLHFPYTAPSAVPAEVAIEYQLSGSYLIFLGGAAATIDALWYAENLLDEGTCQRALVLAVETFEACADLYARGRWLMARPLVEAAACALLLPGGPRHVYASSSGPSRRPRTPGSSGPSKPSRTPGVSVPCEGPQPQATRGCALPDVVRLRVGETLACAPLIALATRGTEALGTLAGLWRGRLATLGPAPHRAAGQASSGAGASGTPPTYNREAS
jgi:hypothetical protein